MMVNLNLPNTLVVVMKNTENKATLYGCVYIYVDTYIYMNTYFNSVKDLTYRNILWIFNKGLASMQYQKTNKLSRYYFLRCCCFCWRC